MISTAGDAALSVADPSTTATGHLVNGAFSLPQALQVRATNAANPNTVFAPLGTGPLTLLTYSGPVSNDAVTVGVQAGDRGQRRAAHRHVREDADVHAVDDDAVS